MKCLITIVLLVASVVGQACDESTSKVDNSNVYAEVISRSHMDLELVTVLKTASRYRVNIVGGKNYDLDTLPECRREDLPGLSWVSSNVATHATGTISTYYTAAYRICVFNARNELVRSYDICNSEVGD